MTDKAEETLKKEQSDKVQMEKILKTGGVTTRNEDFSVYFLTIAGQIEGHTSLPAEAKTTKYEQTIPLLAALEESREIDGVLLLINTVGGDVEAGLAMAELIASMEKPTVSLVLGGGHSIGIPLAVAAKTSFIVPSATMMVHPVRINGLVLGIEQSFHAIQRMQNRITDFITEHSAIGRDAFLQLLKCTDEIADDTGTLIDGKTAVTCGLIDRLGGLSPALAELRRLAGK